MEERNSIFAGSIDTGAEKKTANYISDLAIKQIGQFEDKYKCKVVVYISDNENKMKLTRQLLETHYKEVDARGHNLGLLVYGCAAHYLNLVEKEVTPRTVLSHLVEVAKVGGVKKEEINLNCPTIPAGIAKIANNIAAIIDNVAIHREAMNLQNQLNIVASALDRLQSDSCSLEDAVQIWREVLKDPVPQPYKALIQARFDDWITPFH
ncbi:hypothetical protein Avbf_05317 [Armadillidium vulgare]|nr:hypothetical protein Avbf_05317 [Armadillidium vulgare]